MDQHAARLAVPVVRAGYTQGLVFLLRVQGADAEGRVPRVHSAQRGVRRLRQ